jgi:hypothetical protein
VNPKYPIYIISKGRPNRCLTARELNIMRVPFNIVVEPQEYHDYRKSYPENQIIVTPFSNLGQGSIPVRNFVWEHSISSGYEKHWILDDNIEGFYRLNLNQKYKVADGTIFKCCEDFCARYENIGLAGMNYHTFCKATDKIPPFYLNTRIYSCILIDNKLEYRWRGKFNEDTDLSIRVLKSGLCTVLFNAFLIGKVTTMRMSGGNTNELYEKTDKRLEFAESLAKQHPDVASVTWRFNRWHHKVDYRKFKKNLLSKKANYQQKYGIDNYGMKLVWEKSCQQSEN